MAKIDYINPKCIPGNLFVDQTCIDCWTCYHIAPDIFKTDEDSQCFIAKQPVTQSEWEQAKEALLSCPVTSIGTREKKLNQIKSTLPRKIVDSIYFCGYTSRDSYGATSYLILHPEGNILIDSPRFNSKLVSAIELLGGISYIFLTHKDDVADHEKFQKHFNCQRIIHRYEIEENTKSCEIVCEDEENFRLFDDVEILFSPGHSKGHLLLLYQKKFLFTGDQLFYDHVLNKLFASKSFSWFSWQEQVLSLKKLEQYELEWVFPGHGGWCNKTSESIKEELSAIK